MRSTPMILTGAAPGDRFGRRKLYVIGLGPFTAASIACATAGSASELIASAGRLPRSAEGQIRTRAKESA